MPGVADVLDRNKVSARWWLPWTRTPARSTGSEGPDRRNHRAEAVHHGAFRRHHAGQRTTTSSRPGCSVGAGYALAYSDVRGHRRHPDRPTISPNSRRRRHPSAQSSAGPLNGFEAQSAVGGYLHGSRDAPPVPVALCSAIRRRHASLPPFRERTRVMPCRVRISAAWAGSFWSTAKRIIRGRRISPCRTASSSVDMCRRRVHPPQFPAAPQVDHKNVIAGVSLARNSSGVMRATAIFLRKRAAGCFTPTPPPARSSQFPIDPVRTA